MSLLSLITAPWAILPETLAELQQIYATHLRGQTIDRQAVEARLGRPLANEQQRYELRDGGVAVLAPQGVMAPKANLFMQVSGGISTQMLTQQFESMRADPRVRSVVFAPDSPGGNVLGVPAAAKALAALAAEKPTVTVADGFMASAMLWVGTAANAVFVSGETDQVGSIGVVQRLNWDAANPTSMELVRGKYKRLSVNGAPPSADVVAYHEAQMDYLYTLFVDTVAAHRGVTSAQVLERMADGRLFIGRQAIDSGLADGLATVDEMATQLAENPTRYARRRGRPAVALAGGASTISLAAPVPVSPLRALADMPRSQQLAGAKGYASARGCDLAEALLALGLEPEPAAPPPPPPTRGELAAQACAYAERNRVPFVEACKALGITN